jgi:predicted nuclease of predicted toxin-antitoxin system
VKLLLDQNLSSRLSRTLAAAYPGTTHVRDAGLQAADDDTVWVCVAEQGYVIVSKDADFPSEASCSGIHRKSCGSGGANCSTTEIEEILRARQADLLAFERDEHGAFLVLR